MNTTDWIQGEEVKRRLSLSTSFELWRLCVEKGLRPVADQHGAPFVPAGAFASDFGRPVDTIQMRNFPDATREDLLGHLGSMWWNRADVDAFERSQRPPRKGDWRADARAFARGMWAEHPWVLTGDLAKWFLELHPAVSVKVQTVKRAISKEHPAEHLKGKTKQTDQAKKAYKAKLRPLREALASTNPA